MEGGGENTADDKHRIIYFHKHKVQSCEIPEPTTTSIHKQKICKLLFSPKKKKKKKKAFIIYRKPPVQ